MTSKYTRYTEYNTLWLPELFEKPLVVQGLQIDQISQWKSTGLRIGEAKIEFDFLPNQDLYTRYPEGFFSGLSKIGGLFAIIKLLSFIRLFHKR